MPAEWLLDLGHARLKWAQADGGMLLENTRDAASPDAVDELVNRIRADSSARVWLAATPSGTRLDRVRDALQAAGLHVRVITTGDPFLPVKPGYAGLGVDRWLSLQWPWRQHGCAFCVADCGTALTVDVVDGRGRHLGGWIMPGMDAARTGLLSYVPALKRAVPGPAPVRRPATDTAVAIEAGLAAQQAGAVAFCRHAAAGILGENPLLILTGGDAGRVAPLLQTEEATRQEECRVDPLLVLRGMAMAAQADR